MDHGHRWIERRKIERRPVAEGHCDHRAGVRTDRCGRPLPTAFGRGRCRRSHLDRGIAFKPIVGMAFDTFTGGYYEAASDGWIFAFNAPFQGSMGGHPLNKPVVGMTAG